MRQLSLTAATIALFLLAAPTLAAGNNGANGSNGNHYGNDRDKGNNGSHYDNDRDKGDRDKGDNGNRYDNDRDKGDNGNHHYDKDDGNYGSHDGKGGGNLTTPSPVAAVGLPALGLGGIGAILYVRSRRRKVA
jgi:hypothetical protein